ncbi:hypothetical protein [Roseomonas sp. 18066]|uniref:hypothetical protein n=1 Tax=Roseomonas sp. 18066 TaxID=2681412 RepID=UPI00135CACF0|nr:hypothetical protein [Roseomonas sp. 18066]
MKEIWRGLRRPLVAIALGLVPFWLFLGFSNEVRVNGALVGDSRFNLGGLAMALIGIGLAIGTLRERPRRLPPLVLAALALPICLLQAAVSAEFLSVERLRAVVMGPPSPDPGAGLAEAERARLAASARRPILDEVALRDEFLSVAKRLEARAAEHAAYAGQCHGGARFAAPALPAWLSDTERAEVAAAGQGPRSATPPACSTAQSGVLMKDLVEQALRDRDLAGIIQAAREERFGTAPAAAGPAPGQLEGAPLALGEPGDALRARLGLAALPEPLPGAPEASSMQARLPVAPGVTAYLDRAGTVRALLLEEGFAGTLGGVRPSQTASSVLRRHGPPAREVALQGGVRGLLYAQEDGTVTRFDMRGGAVVGMLLLR